MAEQRKREIAPKDECPKCRSTEFNVKNRVNRVISQNLSPM